MEKKNKEGLGSVKSLTKNEKVQLYKYQCPKELRNNGDKSGISAIKQR